MKTESEIREGIEELRGALKIFEDDETAIIRFRASIAALEWVLK